jgi:hypothetical protein
LFLFCYCRSKRRKNDEINKVKKHNDEDIEEGETAANETTTNKNGETDVTSTTKRVPLSLEEMLERNKKEQEAIAKVIILSNFYISLLGCAMIYNDYLKTFIHFSAVRSMSSLRLMMK